jgi:hypothetical protein
MIIHDDADMATIVRMTVAALKESARHVGKADRAISNAQIAEIEGAIGRLQDMLALKKRMNDANRT